VSGILVWSINRENDGPFKAYKYFGDTLKQANPVSADRTLSTMAEAVVRHTIANSDLEDILGILRFSVLTIFKLFVSFFKSKIILEHAFKSSLRDRCNSLVCH
jgi:hypothetical protein